MSSLQIEQEKYNKQRAEALIAVKEVQQAIDNAFIKLGAIPSGFLSNYEMDNLKAISERTTRLSRKLWRKSAQR